MKTLNLVLLGAAAFVLPSQLVNAAVQVGGCMASLTSYTTISTAVAAAPSGGTVYVCPGTYAEQVFINKPLSLAGVTSGAHDAAILQPPATGLA